jgi:hypothetical protein
VQNYDFAPSPLFGKHVRKAVFLAWKAKSIIKAKEKSSSQMTFFSLFYVTFESLTPTFRLLLKLVFHYPSYLWAYSHHLPVHLQ